MSSLKNDLKRHWATGEYQSLICFANGDLVYADEFSAGKDPELRTNTSESSDLIPTVEGGHIVPEVEAYRATLPKRWQGIVAQNLFFSHLWFRRLNDDPNTPEDEAKIMLERYSLNQRMNMSDKFVGATPKCELGDLRTFRSAVRGPAMTYEIQQPSFMQRIFNNRPRPVAVSAIDNSAVIHPYCDSREKIVAAFQLLVMSAAHKVKYGQWQDFNQAEYDPSIL